MDTHIYLDKERFQIRRKKGTIYVYSSDFQKILPKKRVAFWEMCKVARLAKERGRTTRANWGNKRNEDSKSGMSMKGLVQ